MSGGIEGIAITGSGHLEASDAQALDDALAGQAARSRKTGALSEVARMVLLATARCVPPDCGRDAATAGDARAGVSLGTLRGAADVAQRSLRAVQASGFAGLVPSWYAGGLANATTATLASVYGLGGPNLTFLGGHAGLDAIIHACRSIERGRAASMLAGGFDVPAWSGTDGPHAGTALVWLTSAPGGLPRLATIAGWSQHQGPKKKAADRAGALVHEAMRHRPGNGPVTLHHVDATTGGADCLAAGAPLHLVREVLKPGNAGLHALVVLGAENGSCLVVEVAQGGSER